MSCTGFIMKSCFVAILSFISAAINNSDDLFYDTKVFFEFELGL